MKRFFRTVAILLVLSALVSLTAVYFELRGDSLDAVRINIGLAIASTALALWLWLKK